MWLIVLSDQLPIVALVGSYPTNQLIGHRPIPKRLTLASKTLLSPLHRKELMRACRRFLAGIPHFGAGHPCVTHPSATPSPTEVEQDVRLACVRHAASVYPEPGSNSPSVVYLSTCAHAARKWLIAAVLECDPGQVLQSSTWLFADSCVCSLQITRLILDRNCCGRLRVSPVAVLLSTLQLSRYIIERLFRSFLSTQALLHISGIVSRVYLSIIAIFTKTLVACYFRQNDLIWIHQVI